MTTAEDPLRGAGGQARVAIAGAGLMGRWHADAAARAGGLLVGICDADRQAALALAKRVKTRCAETSLDDLLASASPDVVHICTPLESHADLSERALSSGADVIVEKPLTRDAGETERLLELARERGRILCPVHQLVFQPWLALQPSCGEILSIDYSACSAGAVNRAQADEVADEILSHPLSLFEELLARQARRADVSAALDLGSLDWRVERASPGELRAQATAAGVALSIGISLRGRPPRHELRLTGSRGTLHADLFHGFAWREGEMTSRAYKIARPFWLATHQLASATANLVRRAARIETAYPGLRDLVAAVYASRSAPGSTPGESPLTARHTLAVARARDAILAAR